MSDSQGWAPERRRPFLTEISPWGMCPSTGTSTVVTREVCDIPVVDVFVAGFVCKSVSTENAKRGSYSQCVAHARGQTGENFEGVLGYVRRFRPKLFICEHVSGLLKRALGCGAQGFRGGGLRVCVQVGGRQKLFGPSTTHARLDVGSSLGLSGRSSGWRGAGRP